MTTPKANYPRDCWYVAATSEEVGRTPLGRRLLDTPVVLYRRESGDVVALADRCAHKAYPLSNGRLEGDLLVCTYHGLRYNGAGECVRVPSQPNVPYNACVQAYPVREEPPFVWVWLGDPRQSVVGQIPSLPWLTSEQWTGSGTSMKVAANYMLLHEHFLDLTHIPEVHRAETPPGMDELPPLDEIRVSETIVSYRRGLAPAPLADWEAETMGLPRDRDYQRRHEGTFLSPAVLAEGWEVDGGEAGPHELVRIHAVTPETPMTTHLFFRIARNYVLDRALIDDHLHAVFDGVMAGDIAVVEAIQATAGYEGARAGLHLNADAGVLRVRRIVDAMLATESGRSLRSFATSRTLA